MSYPQILFEISKNHWAMTSESFGGIIRAVKGELTEQDYSIFHGAPQDSKVEALADIGEFEEGNRYTSIDGNVGILFVDGPIVPRSQSLQKVSGITAISALKNEFVKLENDESIETIVLFFDTPGGAVTGISDFASVIAGSEKRTISYVFGMAASAGYWLASAADTIISADTGLVGSVGVVATIKKPDNDNEIEIVSSQSQKKKPDVNTEKGRAEFQAVVDDLADVFISTVAKNRKVDASFVLENFGQGSLLVASKAQNNKMIDGVANFNDLVTSLKSQTGGMPMSFTADSGDVDIEAASDKGAVMSHINRYVAKIEKQDASKKKGPKAMNLEDLYAEHPWLEGRVNAIKKESYAAGADSVREMNRQITKYLDPETSYPAPIIQAAIGALEGTRKVEVFEGAVISYDAMVAAGKVEAAAKDTEEAGETPAQQPVAVSQDGVVRSEADLAIAIQEMRELNGIEA
jgi:ClpP class serine protease